MAITGNDPILQDGSLIPNDPATFLASLSTALAAGETATLRITAVGLGAETEADVVTAVMDIDATRTLLSLTLTVAQVTTIVGTAKPGYSWARYRITSGSGDALVRLFAGRLRVRSRWDGVTGVALSAGASEAQAALVAANAAQAALAALTESMQDVVGAMVAAAGGSYDDAAGTITLPTGGGSGGGTATAVADPKWGMLDAALANRNTHPVPLVFCGSSSVAGSDATDPTKRWVNLLTAAIQAAYPSSNVVAMRTLSEAVAAMPLGNGIQGINAGLAGSASGTYLDATTAAQVGAFAGAVVVFHMVGSNDYLAGYDPASITTNIQTQIARINAAATTYPPFHILIQAFQRGDVSTPAYDWSAYGAAMKAVADARTDTVFIDTSAFFASAGVPWPDPLHILAATNGPHLGDVGHSMMAAVLRGAIAVPDSPSTASSSTSSSVLVVDTFDRADAGTPGTADSGQTWLVHIGTGSISGQKLSVAAADTLTTSLDCGQTDEDVSVDFTWSGQVTGIMVRSDASIQNRLGIFITAANTLTFYKVIANTTTSVATATITALTVGTKYRLRVKVLGTTITAYIDGVQVYTATIPTDANTATASNTRIGIRKSAAGTACTFDNFIARKAA